MADQTDRRTLTAELDAARADLAGYTAALRRDFDMTARVKRSVARNPLAWFGSAAVFGLLLSKIASSRRKPVVTKRRTPEEPVAAAGKAAFVLTALKFAFDFAKPALVAWATRRFIPGADTARSVHRSP